MSDGSCTINPKRLEKLDKIFGHRRVGYMERIGTTDNYSPAPASAESPEWDREWGKAAEFIFTGKNPERFYRLFSWENFHPGSLEKFLNLKFSLRAATLVPGEGQCVMIEISGRNDRHDCLQMSHAEFRANFTKAHPEQVVSQRADHIKARVKRVLPLAA